MENDLKTTLVITFVTLTGLLGGCRVNEELEKQSLEIGRLNHALENQYGARAADLAFAERQVGIYHGCTFLFNVCSQDTTDVGEKLIRNGFAGSSSAWWWLGFIGKLSGIGGFLGLLLWVPRHLYVVFTLPVQARIDDAENLISSLDEKVKDANQKRTKALQQASAIRREIENLESFVAEEKNSLVEATQAVAQARDQLNSAKNELLEVTRLREDFKRF